MAIRNTLLGGTDITFGEKPWASADFNDTLNAAYRNDYRFLGGTFTEASTGATGETEVGEFIITANSIQSEALIIVPVRARSVRGGGTANQQSTFRIRTGTSDTATSNTERQSLLLGYAGEGLDNHPGTMIFGGYMIARITASDEDFTGNVYVHVTGLVGNAGATAYMDSLVVLGK